MELYLYVTSANENANSHAGRHDGFEILWSHHDRDWFWKADNGDWCGPFETSKAAYDDYKNIIDERYQCEQYQVSFA